MSLRNPFGDFELTDPQAMRALAHPVRLAALSHLQRHGPATATQLSEHVGASPSVTSWHLRHLATFGLVEDGPPPEGGADRRQRWWRAVARGFRFEMPDTPDGMEAARLLRTELMSQAIDTAQHWLLEQEPALAPEWGRLAGSANTRMRLTPDEARGLEEAVEELFAPYVQRAEADAPPHSCEVRFIRMTLPEPEEP